MRDRSRRLENWGEIDKSTKNQAEMNGNQQELEKGRDRGETGRVKEI